MKQVFKVLCQFCVSSADPSSKMTAIGSDLLKQFSSLQPLEGFWQNLKGRKSSTSSTKDVFSCGSVSQYGRSGPWLFETFSISLQLLIGFNGRQNLKGNPAPNSNNYPIKNTGAIVHDLGPLGPPVFQLGVPSGTYLVQSWIQPWTNIANGHKTDRNMMCTFLYYKFSQDPFSGLERQSTRTS